MGNNVVLTGIVLSAMPVGEYDRRVSILTKERGRITAFARGARRPTNQLVAATGPFSFGEFEVYEGRSSYTIAKATIKNYFRELSQDPVTACYGFYFLEVAEYYGQENNDEKEMLGLLYQSLRALEKESLDNHLVRRIFELKVLQIQGEYPEFYRCASCGKKEHLEWFSFEKRSMVCSDCNRDGKAFWMDESTLYTFQYILYSGIEKLYTFAVSGQVLEKISTFMTLYLNRYQKHHFKSLDILATIEN